DESKMPACATSCSSATLFCFLAHLLTTMPSGEGPWLGCLGKQTFDVLAVLPVYRSSYHYRSPRAGQAHLIERIKERSPPPACATAIIAPICCCAEKNGGNAKTRRNASFPHRDERDRPDEAQLSIKNLIVRTALWHKDVDTLIRYRLGTKLAR